MKPVVEEDTPKARPVLALPAGTEALLGMKEVAAALGVSRRILYAMLSAGEYPAPDLKLGRWAKWRVGTHNEWLIGRCRKRGG